jgi:phage gpG-like protein
MSLRINIDGKALIGALGKLARRFEDVREAWPSVIDLLRRIVERQFATQGAAGLSGAWQPLTSQYVGWKASRFPGKPILRASDEMFGSLVGTGGAHIEEVSEREFLFGSADPKARRHQEGTDEMDARRIFDLRPEDEEQLGAALQGKLAEFARDLGFDVR